MKWIGITLLVIVLLAIGAISSTIGWRPFIGPQARPPTGRKFEASPTRRARGQYLVESLGDCFGCHGEHDWKKHDAPLIAGTAGAGYPEFRLAGLPGRVIPSNIHLTRKPALAIGPTTNWPALSAKVLATMGARFFPSCLTRIFA